MFLLLVKMCWSLTYAATPIAVAVREALFTCSGLRILIRQVAVYSRYLGVLLQYVSASG